MYFHQGAKGYYDFGINSKKNVICYNIRLYGFRGEYESAADTASMFISLLNVTADGRY